MTPHTPQYSVAPVPDGVTSERVRRGLRLPPIRTAQPDLCAPELPVPEKIVVGLMNECRCIEGVYGRFAAQLVMRDPAQLIIACLKLRL